MTKKEPDLKDMFFNILSENQKKMISFSFKQNLLQSDLDSFLQEWDIGAAPMEEILLLAYLMKTHQNLEFNQYTGPRLTGVLNYYRFKNLKLISHYMKIGQKLNQKKIIPMIIKGGAMKFLRPDLYRIMGDIDIFISPEINFSKITSLITKMGYTYIEAIHSIDLHLPESLEGICDIHRFIETGTNTMGYFWTEALNRAKLEKIFDVKTYLPCAEDLVFILLLNLGKNIEEKTSSSSIVFSFFDIDYLIHSKSNFNWNIILENTVKTCAFRRIYLSIKFINHLLPNFLPEENLSSKSLITDISTMKHETHCYDLVSSVKKRLKYTNVFEYYIQAGKEQNNTNHSVAYGEILCK